MKERMFHLDFLRSFLIFLIIFGHFIEGYWRSQPGQFLFLKKLWVLIYYFHIPAFAVISGFLSKTENNPEYIKKLFYSLIVPYIIFQILYRILAFSMGFSSEPVIHFFSEPYSHLWYLTALFFWRILLPVFASIRYSFLLALMIGIVSIFAKDAEIYMSLGRTLRFFPYFIFGFILQRHLNLKFQDIQYQILSSLFILSVILISFYFPVNGDEVRVLNQFSANEENPAASIFHQIRIYFFGFGLSISLFILFFRMNIRWNFLSVPGRYSLYPYVLHLAAVLFFLKSRFAYNLKESIGNEVFLSGILLLFSVFLSFIFSSHFIRKVTSILLKPQSDFFERYGAAISISLILFLLIFQNFII
ncbi:MAG: acyltransferase family protein [Spirochaetia bacterium]|nr:acyltransferase family protein [Spirochaetia bacterium]